MLMSVLSTFSWHSLKVMQLRSQVNVEQGVVLDVLGAK